MLRTYPTITLRCNPDISPAEYNRAVEVSKIVDSNNLILYSDAGSFKIDPEYDFVCVPNYLFSELLKMKFDLAINTLSFAEMHPTVVDTYINGLTTMLGSDGILFEQNFDNSHFKIPTFCNPEPIIQKYFGSCEVISDSHPWGRATVWRKPLSIQNQRAPGFQQQTESRLWQQNQAGHGTRSISLTPGSDQVRISYMEP
jgi:hypothetical protein